MKQLKENRHALRLSLASMLGIFLVVMFPVYESSELPIVIIFIATTSFIIIAHPKKNVIPKAFIKVLIVQLVILGYMSLSLIKAPVVTYYGAFQHNSFFSNNMFLTTLACFLVFNLGVIYGYQQKMPLVIFSTALGFFLLATSIYFIFRVDHPQPSLMIGSMALVVFSYVMISPLAESNRNVILLSLFMFLFLSYMSYRGALLALLFFLITWYGYQKISKSRLIFNLYPVLIFTLLISSLFMYLSGIFEFAQEASLQLFNKSIDSGRPLIWVALLEFVSDNLIFGMGINQASQFLLSELIPFRNLSSHSTILEVQLRGGILLTLMFALLSALIWSSFRSKSANPFGRAGSGFMIALLVYSLFAEIGLTQSILLNVLIWLLLGVAYGRCSFLSKNICMLRLNLGKLTNGQVATG